MKTKVCQQCRLEKTVDCFNRSKAEIDGFQKRCRTCWQRTYEQQKRTGSK